MCSCVCACVRVWTVYGLAWPVDQLTKHRNWMQQAGLYGYTCKALLCHCLPQHFEGSPDFLDHWSMWSLTHPKWRQPVQQMMPPSTRGKHDFTKYSLLIDSTHLQSAPRTPTHIQSHTHTHTRTRAHTICICTCMCVYSFHWCLRFPSQHMDTYCTFLDRLYVPKLGPCPKYMHR